MKKTPKRLSLAKETLIALQGASVRTGFPPVEEPTMSTCTCVPTCRFEICM